MTNPIHVAYAVDDNYALALSVSLISLSDTLSSGNTVTVHVLLCDTSDETRRNLERTILSDSVRMKIYEVETSDFN